VNGKASYQAGARFERKTQAHLRDEGYIVTKGGGSRGTYDLHATKSGQTLLVQCKRHGKLDPAPWNALWLDAYAAGALPIVAMRHGTGIAYRLIVDIKDGSGSRQPWQPWTTDEVAA
jgi:Holliday junction resolvase